MNARITEEHIALTAKKLNLEIEEARHLLKALSIYFDGCPGMKGRRYSKEILAAFQNGFTAAICYARFLRGNPDN